MRLIGRVLSGGRWFDVYGSYGKRGPGVTIADDHIIVQGAEGDTDIDLLNYVRRVTRACVVREAAAMAIALVA